MAFAGSFLFLLLFQGQPSAEQPQETLLPLKKVLSGREHKDYQRKPQYRDRMKVFRKAFIRQSRLLQGQINKHQIESALETLENLRSLTRHSMEERSRRVKDRRSNDVKKLEITLRKLLETLEDLKRSVPFEYHVHFNRCIQNMEELRNRLLTQLFNQTQKLEPTSEPTVTGPVQAHSGLSTAPATSVTLMWAHQLGDGFTDREYSKIQLAQELTRRVDVFLEIAKRRLEEIKKRINPEEAGKKTKDTDKKKEKNAQDSEDDSLEFHTYWDMVRSYDRAVEGIMINIDEKDTHKLAGQKDIRKALKKFCKQLKNFVPQFDPIGKLALEQQDEDLIAEVKQAKQTSSTAQKGCLAGLGPKWLND